jgi:CHASE2 domain-containing sensor protein
MAGLDRQTSDRRIDDTMLIREAQRGNRAAFEELVRHYDQAVLRLALHLTGTEHDAQDVYQDAFLKAYKNIGNPSQDDFVFGRFRRREEFDRIPAGFLTCGPVRSSLIRGRIVLIGATWSKSQGGLGGWIESFDSPVGELPGVYFHANYIEDLAEDPVQYKPPVRLRLGETIDVVAALLLYFFYHALKKHPRKQLWLLLVFVVLLIGSYMTFAMFNRYLDFILPMFLCFFHLSFEHFRTYLKLWWHQPEVP